MTDYDFDYNYYDNFTKINMTLHIFQEMVAKVQKLGNINFAK